MASDGIKRLTADNWLEPDHASAHYYSLDDEGQPYPTTGEEWVRHITTPQLAETVPAEVRTLFEVARASLAYGFLFYPLYTLGAEQLLRVVDAAAAAKCSAMGAPPGVRSFQNRVEFLASRGVIPPADRRRWDAIVGFRNFASHPIGQTILSPGMVVEMLTRMAEDINGLFR